jgi:GNAT superfamily N-acetyltransferase
MFTVRDASPEDAGPISQLWGAYLHESHDLANAMTQDVFREEGFDDDASFSLVVATGSDGSIWGALAWRRDYDLHHAVRGVTVSDLYVYRRYRGFGVAPSMLAFLAARGKKFGARFLRGHVGDTNQVARQLYDRVAVYFPGADAHVGGRAFDHLAHLAGKSPRDIARSLPKREWNYE